MKKRFLLPLLVALIVGSTQLLLVAPAEAAPKKKAPPKHSAPARAHASTEDADDAPVALRAVDPNVPPTVRALSVLLFDARTGKILYEKNADGRRPIASTQKLLTALIVTESGALNTPVEVIPEDTFCEPTKLDFRPGERYTRHDLVVALLVHSCNDVARLLARDNAGSIDAFADRMNARARELGARNSHFVNPNGLPAPEPQYSTARDLARIARVAYSNAFLRSIVSMKTLTFQYNNGRLRDFTNTNKVLARYPYCNGMKTGYTEAAGHCLVSSATDGNRSVISVALGDNKSIWNDSQALLSWGLIAPETPANFDLDRDP